MKNINDLKEWNQRIKRVCGLVPLKSSVMVFLQGIKSTNL